ncbi:MAG: sigma-54-dependent Fis family transcriptional regulator, partial [Paracoccaceae bacterium]
MTANDWEFDISSASKIHRPPSLVPAVNDSWTRCRGFGLSASAKPAELVLSEEKFKDVLDQNESIRHLVLPELELLYNQIAGTNFMVAYADGGGVVLDSIQDHNFRAGEGGKTVIPGSVWVEKHRGTNALYQAIHTRQPAIVTGRDHFFHKLSDLSCFAAPIFDHEMQLVGVIDATSNAKARNEHTLALVKLAACNIENRLFTEHFCDSLILMFHARHEYLPTTSVAMIAVDDYGFIEGANSNAKSVLSGLDIGRKQHFGEVFDVQFFDIVDQVRSNDIISIRDRMGAVVFMKAQQPISRRVVNVEGDLIINKGEARPLASVHGSNPADRHKKSKQCKLVCTFEDEVLVMCDILTKDQDGRIDVYEIKLNKELNEAIW